jgi:hypothetical protein
VKRDGQERLHCAGRMSDDLVPPISPSNRYNFVPAVTAHARLFGKKQGEEETDVPSAVDHF